MRENRLLRSTWRGLETDSRWGYGGTPGGNGEQRLGPTYGVPRQPSTLPEGAGRQQCLPATRPVDGRVACFRGPTSAARGCRNRRGRESMARSVAEGS